ncbi:hypothetical protein MHU86_7265 [Fragilaria crotonensis]|nr:hypothetical protein MHU86_7265 [Fragilaria crotonensis]
MDELPPPLNDKQLYDYYYQETRKLNNPRHRFWQRKICSAKMHGYNPPVWVSVVEGQGIIGTFATEDEANQRAFCVVMMFEDEKSGKLARIKKLLDQRSWPKATDVGGESKGGEKPVSDKLGSPPHLSVKNPNPTAVTGENESWAASDAARENVTRAEDVPPTEPRTDTPLTDEIPEEHLDATRVEDRPEYTPDGEILDEQAVVDATSNMSDLRRSQALMTSMRTKQTNRNIQSTCASPCRRRHSRGFADEPKRISRKFSRGFNVRRSLETFSECTYRANWRLIGESSSHCNCASFPVAQATGKRNESGQGTEEKQLSSLNKRKIDGSTAEASKKQKVVPTIPSGFSTKAVEMRNPVSGVIEKTFPNAAEAAKANYINVTKLMEICRHGGGLIGTHLFRYIEPSEEDALLLNRASSRQERLGYGNNNGNSSNSSKSSNNNNKTDEVVNTTKASLSHKLSIATAGKRNKRVLPLESNRLTQQQVTTRPSSTAAKATGRAQKPLPGPFDLSTLLPIRRNLKPPLKPRHTIELVELRTLKVLVCFRGTTDASRALGLDRKAISGACESYSKTRPITFGTFTLRYAQAGHFSAYVYGDDAKDYMKHRKETHAETAARFKRIFEAHQKDGTLGTRPIIKPEKVLEMGEDVAVEEEVEISSAEGGLDAFTLCIVCQEVPPSIVFEPCYHAVVCRACAGIACKSFCPTYCQVIVEERPLSSWNQRLARLSNLASIICVIDCTVLPLLAVLLSVLGFAEQPHQWQWLHELGHGVAIFFVLPVGAFTAALNFLQHKRASLVLMALVGLLLIYLANYSHEPHAEEGDLQHWLLHTGQTHRLTNVLGCSLLLVSNYKTRQIGKCHDNKCNTTRSFGDDAVRLLHVVVTECTTDLFDY